VTGCSYELHMEQIGIQIYLQQLSSNIKNCLVREHNVFQQESDLQQYRQATKVITISASVALLPRVTAHSNTP
jgi:hypothetical protein